jgi:flagellar basal-body rod protein FlgF
MDTTNFVSLSTAVALQRSMDVTAHNLANANTTGFKASRPLFEALVSGQVDAQTGEPVNFVKDMGDFIDHRQGALTRTGNQLDIALSGQGWFAYEGPAGQPVFSRNGSLTANSEGELVSVQGQRILGGDGGTITLPQNLAGNFSIAQDGTIAAENGDILAKIGVFDPAASGELEAIGAGQYVPKSGADAELAPSLNFEVVQGFVELSNVQPILEMTKMMEIQRAYERSVKLISGGDDLTRQAIQRLGRLM